jgi:tetratricopeptide (TPR) repeat protein
VLERLGDYTLEEELARGGAGVVFRARDAAGAPVAVKLLLAAQNSSERTLKRFRREAQVLARLNHPHVVRVREVGDEQGLPYLVMDLVDGVSLQQELDARGPLEPRRAARLLLQVTDAITHAHQSGLLHRDLKPGNILLDAGDQTRLTDFGLVKEPGQLLGTPGYMPPEQAHGQLDRLGPASDVYGLGATLYALLSGHPPHEGETLVEVLSQLGDAPRPLRAQRPQVPPGLEAICLRCLEPIPERRYPTASALRNALTEWLAGKSAPPRRSAAPFLAGGLTASGLVLAVLLVVVRGAPPAAPPDPAGGTQATPSAPATDLHDPAALVLQSQARLDSLAPWAECLAPLNEVLERDPEHVDALATRALVRAHRDFAAAEAELATLESRHPEHPQLLLARALPALWANDSARELELLDRALVSDAHCVSALCRRAETLLRLGRHDDALATAERAVSAAPDRPWAWVVRARAHTDAADRQRDLDRATALAPGHPRLLTALGLRAATDDDMPAALELMARAVAQAPHRAHTHFGQAKVLQQAGRSGEAAEAYRRGIDLRESGPAWAAYARVLATGGDTSAAIPAAERAVELQPDSVWNVAGLTSLLLAEQRLEDAERLVGTMRERFPDHPTSLRLAALCRYQRGMWSEAIPLLEQALQEALQDDAMGTEYAGSATLLADLRFRTALNGCTDPEQAVIYALSQRHDGAPGRAQAWCERALELAPEALSARAVHIICQSELGLPTPELPQLTKHSQEFWSAYALARLMLQSLDDPQKGQTLVDRLVTQFPAKGAARRLRADVLDRLGDRAAALRDLDAAVALEGDPGLVLSLYQRGGLQGLVDAKAAEADLRRATEIDSKHPLGVVRLVALLQAQDRHREALFFVRTLERLEPHGSRALILRANSLHAQGELTAAHRSARAATWVAPEDPNAWYVLGLGLRALDREAEAIDALEEALRISPDHARARAELTELRGEPR